MNLRFHNEVSIPVDGVLLSGELTVPLRAESIVIFSHGSGSSRLSPRNLLVARFLQDHHIGTLLFDLLTEEEDQEYKNRFDIDLMTGRLVGVTKWVMNFPAAKNCALGYFGASTGAASAIRAAERIPGIKTVVSRGGRPDLAGAPALSRIKTPTLLIVGSLDHDVMKLNQSAFEKMNCVKKIEQVPGATHLFEEPGTMEKVCKLSIAWFEKHLQPVEKKKVFVMDLLL